MIVGTFLEPTAIEFLKFLGCIIAGLTIYLLWLLVVKNHRENHARKPTLDEELRKLSEMLKTMAPSEEVDKILEQLSSVASKAELAAVTAAAAALIKDHKEDVERQLKDQRSYAHKEIHDIRNSLDALVLTGENRKQEMLASIAAVGKELGDRIDRTGTEQYKRRRAMHREINSQREALAFMAGIMNARGDSSAAEHVRNLIQVRDDQEDS